MVTAGRNNIGRVIVTRPAHDAAMWVEQLKGNGVDAVALPLIEIAAASSAFDELALRTAKENLARYAACMFVSGNAVEHFFKEFVPFGEVSRARAATETIATDALRLPAALRFLAPGPGTAQALRSAGVPANRIDCPPPDAGQFDSAALWAVIGSRDWRGLRVLLVRGHTDELPGGLDTQPNAPADGPLAVAAPRDWLTQQWQAAGCEVDVVNVYERRAPGLTAQQLELARAASCDGSVWLFSSSEAVANLVRARALAGTDWTAARAVATHPRIVQTVQAAGWGTVAPSRPSLPEIVRVLRSIELTLP